MDFVLSEEQQSIFDMAHDFAEQMIAPHAVNWDQTEQMPKDVLRQSADLGLASIYVPEAHGGSGLSRLDATLVFEALAMGCPSVSSFLSIHNMVAWMVSSFGSDELRETYLADLCSMKKIGSYCLTEPWAQSDSMSQFFSSNINRQDRFCLLYTSPSPRDKRQSRMPSSA